MPHHLVDNPLPDKEFLLRVGQVSIEWSIIELMLEQVLSRLCNADTGSMFAITRAVSNSIVTRAITELAAIKVDPPELAIDLAVVISDVETLRTERNWVIHGIWTASEAPGFASVQTIGMGRAEVLKDSLHSVNDLDEIIGELVEVQGKLLDILIRMGVVKPN